MDFTNNSCVESSLSLGFIIGGLTIGTFSFVVNKIFCNKSRESHPITYHAEGEYSKQLLDGSYTLKRGKYFDGNKDGEWSYKTIPAFKKKNYPDVAVDILSDLVDGHTYEVLIPYVKGIKHGKYLARLSSPDNGYCVTKIEGQYDTGSPFGVFTYYRGTQAVAEVIYEKFSDEFNIKFHPENF